MLNFLSGGNQGKIRSELFSPVAFLNSLLSFFDEPGDCLTVSAEPLHQEVRMPGAASRHVLVSVRGAFRKLLSIWDHAPQPPFPAVPLSIAFPREEDLKGQSMASSQNSILAVFRSTPRPRGDKQFYIHGHPTADIHVEANVDDDSGTKRTPHEGGVGGWFKLLFRTRKALIGLVMKPRGSARACVIEGGCDGVAGVRKMEERQR